MQCTATFLGEEKNVISDTHVFALNERLHLALEGSRQLAFDWHIPSDRLFFSGTSAYSFHGWMLEASKISHSAALLALIHADDLKILRSRVHEALKAHDEDASRHYQVELRLKDAICAWRWISISGKLVERDERGQAIRMVGTFSDIDERKRTENTMDRLRNLYVVLSQANQAIVRFRERDPLLKEICRIAVENGRFRLASIDLIDAGRKQIVPIAAFGTVSDTVKMQEDMTETAQANFGAAVGFPLRSRGRLLGVLNLYAEEQDFFDAPLIDPLEQMAKDISFAVDEYQRDMQRKAIKSALPDSEKIKSAILTAALDCIVSIDQNGEIVSFNQAAETSFGYRSQDVLGRSMADILIPPEWRERHRRGIERYLATGESSMFNRRVELTAMRADGTRFPIELAVVPLNVQDRPIFTAFIRDITERKRSEAIQLGQNKILNMVATGAALPEILTEIARFVERQSDLGLCSILRHKEDGARMAECIAPSLPQSFVVRVCEALQAPCARPYPTGQVTAVDLANDPLWPSINEPALEHGLRASISWPILGKTRKVLGTFALYFREPTTPSKADLQLVSICTKLAGIAIESRAAEERIRYLAHYDGLTSLPNRFLFKEYLDLALRNARRHGEKFAVLFLDLDKFKEINDTLGHDAGDMVLREMAKRLLGCLRHTDKIARMGGDEFYVLIEELHNGRHAAEVAQKLLDEAARPVFVGGKACSLSVSIGIAIYPDDGSDGQTLLKNADDAMYRAKEQGKNGFQFFSSQFTARDAALPVFVPSSLFRAEAKKLMRAN